MADNPWNTVPVWHELMSLDPEGARKSYEEVVGLTVTPLEGAPFPYTLWLQDGDPIGGLVPPQEQKKGLALRFDTPLGDLFRHGGC